MNTSARTDTSVTVMWTWTNCKGAEPSNIKLTWSPEPDLYSVRNISSFPASYNIADLVASTNYSIMITFTDVCGSISAETIVSTLPITGESKCINQFPTVCSVSVVKT